MAGNNPILASDLAKNDGAFKELREELIKLREENKAYVEQIVADAAKLEKASKKVAKAGEDQYSVAALQAKQTEDLRRKYNQYTVSLDDTAVKIAALRNAQADQNRLLKLEAKLAAATAGSYDQLSAQYSINKIRLNAMSNEERASTKAGQELVKTSRDIYEEMKRLQAETGKTSLNVGNYTKTVGSARLEQKKLNAELKQAEKEYKNLMETVGTTGAELAAQREKVEGLKTSIDDLGEITGKTSDELNSGLISNLENVGGAAGSAVSGVKGLGQSFKALLANPVVLILTLIVGGLIALGKAFGRSERGAELMTKATAVFNAVLSNLTQLAVAVYDALESAFSDPQQSLKDIGKLLKENLVNRLTALPLLAVAAGNALKAIYNRDLPALKKSGEDALTAVTQLVTGLDGEQQSNLADAIKETVSEIDKEVNAFVKLEQAKRSVRRANRELTKSIEGLITQEELSKSVADDVTKSFAERKKAADEARVALEERSKKEVQLARNNLSLINTELDLRRANGEQVESLLDQQLSAYQELSSAQREYTLAVRDNERTRAELKQDELEKDLDILIDGFDNQKTINERRIADDRHTFEERRKLLDETIRLSDDSFKKQVETIQQFTGIQVDANDLINTSDAVVLNQKIRSLGLSEIIEGRLLEIIRDRRTANQDLEDAANDLFDAEKKAAEASLKAKIDARDKERQAALKTYDEQADLKEAEFNLTKRTEAEKTRFRLQAEADRLAAVIKINEELEGDLSDTVIETYKKRIAGINNQINSLDNPESDKGLLSKLGINLSASQKAAVKTSTDFIKAQLLEIFAVQKQLADQAVQNADRRVSSAEAALQAEITAAQNGSAARVETARAALAQEQKLQQEALEQQKKAEKEQRLIQTAQQTVNLITAVSKIFAELPIFAAIPAVALMIGTFAAAKIKASRAAKETFGEGGWEEFNYGGSHSSGNDIYLGQTKSGKARYVERNEGMQIFSAKAMKRDAHKIRTVADMLNKGTFDETYIDRQLLSREGIDDYGGVTEYHVDMEPTNTILTQISHNTNSREGRNHLGQRVVTRGNETITYV